MNSTSEETKTGVQPLDADDANLADLSSGEELSGASEGDGPLHHEPEARGDLGTAAIYPAADHPAELLAAEYRVDEKRWQTPPAAVGPHLAEGVGAQEDGTLHRSELGLVEARVRRRAEAPTTRGGLH